MAIVIKGARLIDGTGRAPLERAVVAIEGNRVSAVGPEGQVSIPAGATVVDAAGRTVLPGLMDLHGGLIRLTPAEAVHGATEKNIAIEALRAAAHGKRCLEVGVTTVRVDTSGDHGVFAVREAFASGVVPGPRLLVPGRGICMTGGHGWAGAAREADGPDGVRKAAREELRAGADWIKLMASGGAGTASERVEDAQFTAEEMRAAVEEAHKKGKYVFAHVSCAEAARNCIAAGVDSIEHGILLEEDNVREMVEKGIFLVPTLGIYRKIVERGALGLVPDYMYRKSIPVRERHAQSFRMAMEAGVKIASGTDSGREWYPMGDSLLFELETMNQEGMAPMEALISATRRAAECLHLDSDLGTLEAGKLADVLIVEDDPLAAIGNLKNAWMVLKEGKVVFQKQA